eukprot:s446_g27.t1
MCRWSPSTAIAFPGVIGILLLAFVFTKVLRRSANACIPATTRRMIACYTHATRILHIPPLPERAYLWTWHGTACLAGKFCQVTFPTMANVALSPMMCYSHPGGQMQSLVKYSNTLCGTSDQAIMLGAGACLLCLAAAFLALCIWAALRAPRLSAQGQAAVKFLFADFRPDTAWFALITLSHGLFLSLATVAAPDSPNVQLVLMHSVILISLVFQSSCQPWKSSALNLVDTVSQSLFLTILGVGLGGLEQSDGATDVLHVLGALLCVALLAVLGVFASILIVAVVMEKIGGCGGFGQTISGLGKPPDPAPLFFLLQNLASSMQKIDSRRVSLTAALAQLGTHDARISEMCLVRFPGGQGEGFFQKTAEQKFLRVKPADLTFPRLSVTLAAIFRPQLSRAQAETFYSFL